MPPLDIRSALVLVRHQFNEEQDENADEKVRADYDGACSDYPVTMQLAQTLFALEYHKNPPQ